MQHQPSSGGYALPDHEQSARVVLAMLIHHHPGLLEIDEMVREFAGTAYEREVASIAVHDGLAELVAAGLAHQFGRFAFATLSAVRAAQITG